MSDVNHILMQQLAEAQDQGDRPRQIALAVALLKERSADTAQLHGVIAEAAAALVAVHQHGDLDAAAEWAQTWHRHTRQPRAKELHQELVGRAAEVRAAQDQLCKAMAGGDTVALRDAIAALEAAPGRIGDTVELLAEAKRQLAQSLTEARRRLAERLAAAGERRRQVEALVPFALDRAVALLPALRELDPAGADDPAFAGLPARAEAVAALHAGIEAALAAPALPPLERALAALGASGDRLSGSEALAARAATEAGLRRARTAAQAARCAAADRTRPDLALPEFEALAVLDPGAAELAGLSALRAAQARLLELHRLLAAGCAHPGRPGLAAAIAELRASPMRLEDSARAIDEAAVALRRHRERRARLLARAWLGAKVAAAAAVLVAPVWWRDAHGRAAFLAAGDGEQGQALAQAFAGDWSHVFYRGAARERATLLARRLDEAAFAAAAGLADPDARRVTLTAYLARPAPGRAAEAAQRLAAASLELEDRAFAAAIAIADPRQRLAALDAYAAQSQVAERAARAREVAAQLRRERDQAAWQAALDASDPQRRLELLDDYLRLDGQPAHAAEVAALRAAGEAAIARQRAVQADDAAWAEAGRDRERRAAIAAVAGYLAGDTIHGHDQEARRRLDALRTALDDEAWRAAVAEADPRRRAERLAAYLAGDTVRAHAGEAERALAEAAWAAASAPGAPAERLARVRGYLADPAGAPHRGEALQLERDLAQAIDQERWVQARSLPDLPGRIHAIDDYLGGPGQHAFTIAARAELARCLERIAALPDAELAMVPADLLARLPVEQLARLPDDRLALLPATVQARLARRPSWSAEAGVDEHGRWATLALGAATMRFRYIFPGTVRVAGGVGPAGQVGGRGFWLAEQECPQATWVEVLGGFFSSRNPSVHRGDDLPVDSASFADCQAFVAACNLLLERRPVAARVRLPSVAEWRFAAFTASDGAAGLDRGVARGYAEAERTALAWGLENGGGASRPAGSGERDRWGLLNLLGNLAEWATGEGGAQRCGGAWNVPLADCLPGRAVAAGDGAAAPGTGLRLVVEELR